MNGLRLKLPVAFSLLLAFVIGGAVSGQTGFDLKPAAPSETISTWVDLISVSYQLHLTLPPGLKVDDTKTDLTEQNSFVIARAIKVLNRDAQGRVTLQVAYVPIPPETSLPSVGVGVPVQLTAPLEGRTFQIRCEDESVLDVTNGGSKPLTSQEGSIVQRECREFARNTLKEDFFSNMKLGDSKELSTSSQLAMLSEDLNDFVLVKSALTLQRLEAESTGSVATFAVQSNVRTDTSLSKLFDDCNGTLITDTRGLLTELKLKCSAKASSNALPNGAEVKTDGEMNLVFFRRILGL